MVALKAGEVSSFLARPDFSKTIILVYGPDIGLVSERAKLLAEKTGVDLADAFAVSEIDAQNLTGDNSDQVQNEAYTVPMFGGKRLVRIRNAGNETALIASLETLVSDPPDQAIVLIESGDLKKGSKLRTLAEKAKNAIALPCYADNERSLQELLDEEMRKNAIRIDQDARQFVLSRIGGDRRASRAELEKLTLYAYQTKTLTLDDARDILGDSSGLDFDAVVDAVIDGDLVGFDRSLAKLQAAGKNPTPLLLRLSREYQQLEMMRDQMDQTRSNPQAVVAQARPPIFFNRKRIMEQALRFGKSDDFRRAQKRVRDAILESRQNSANENAVVHMALLALAANAGRRKASQMR